MDYQILSDDIFRLRQRLKLLGTENKALKERLRAIEDTCEKQAQKLKSTGKDRCFAQKLLHSYSGASVTVKDGAVEVSIRPVYSGVQHNQYKILFQNIRKRTWQLAGYNLPLSVYREKGTCVSKERELAKFIREVSREIQAYAVRKYQVTGVEEIFKKKEASVWYSTKFQKVLLTVPIKVLASNTKFVGEITLHYETDEILPFEVTTVAEGLDKENLETLKTRLSDFFLHCSLLTVIEEEFECDDEQEGSVSISIQSNQSS